MDGIKIKLSPSNVVSLLKLIDKAFDGADLRAAFFERADAKPGAIAEATFESYTRLERAKDSDGRTFYSLACEHSNCHAALPAGMSDQDAERVAAFYDIPVTAPGGFDLDDED